MRTVRVMRYVTPLREGGSLPAIVEADDSGLYVLKFRGAGQGRKALVAELLVGELARSLGLQVPEIVLAELDPVLGRNEPDSEIRELIKSSAGLNLGLDYLPGSLMYDPLAGDPLDAKLASEIVWIDALTMNVDRTAKNPNLLSWHRRLWLIDHGAALYFHDDWPRAAASAQGAFPAIRDHVLLAKASELREVDERLRPRVVEAAAAAVRELPDLWLEGEPGFPGAAAVREAYRAWFEARAAATPFLDEALRARAQLV